MRAWLLALGVVLAGCSSSQVGSTDASIGQPLVALEGQARLAVEVLDVELRPIPGALVGIGEAEPLVADEAGAVRIIVEPGSHRLIVQAPGFTAQVRDVTVGADEEKMERFVLQAGESQVPYVQVLQYAGYSVCDLMVVVVSDRLNPCPIGQAKNSFQIEMEESWRFHVAELEWSQGVAGYDSFRLFASNDGDCASASPCYGLVVGNRYARLEGEPGKTDLVKFYDPWKDNRGLPYPEGNFTMVLNAQWIGLFTREINGLPGNPCQLILTTAASGYKPGCLGVGVSTGIAFDAYQSIFHWQDVPDRGPCCPVSKYSALPDG